MLEYLDDSKQALEKYLRERQLYYSDIAYSQTSNAYLATVLMDNGLYHYKFEVNDSLNKIIVKLEFGAFSTKPYYSQVKAFINDINMISDASFTMTSSGIVVLEGELSFCKAPLSSRDFKEYLSGFDNPVRIFGEDIKKLGMGMPISYIELIVKKFEQDLKRKEDNSEIFSSDTYI